MQATDSTLHRKKSASHSFFRFSWLPDWLAYLTYFLVFLTISKSTGQFFYLLELCSHFAVQLFVLAFFLVGYWLINRKWILALTACSTLFWYGLHIYPWLFAAKPASAALKPDMRVLHANVLYTREEMESTIQMIREHKPDIFVLQEMTPESIEKVSTVLQNDYPYRDTVLAKDPCFLMVASRTPILVDQQAKRDYMVIHLMTTINDHDVSFITVHPRTPIWPDWFAERNKQLAFVAEKARQVPHSAVVIGDFNVSVFSPVYANVFEKDAKLTACRKGFGLQATWPRFFPPAMLPIDHAFVNTGFQTVNFQTLSQSGSDHKALVVDLAFR